MARKIFTFPMWKIRIVVWHAPHRTAVYMQEYPSIPNPWRDRLPDINATPDTLSQTNHPMERRLIRPVSRIAFRTIVLCAATYPAAFFLLIRRTAAHPKAPSILAVPGLDHFHSPWPSNYYAKAVHSLFREDNKFSMCLPWSLVSTQNCP